MACYLQWAAFSAKAVAFGVGDAAEEVFSEGLATPAVVAEAAVELYELIESANALVECYENNGDTTDAQKVKSIVDTLKAELEILNSLA